MSTNKLSPIDLVNDYITLDARIKDLEKRRDALKEQIIDLGEGQHYGEFGTVSVTLSQRRTLSKDLVAAKLTAEDFEACYSLTTAITVRATVKKSD